MIVVETMRKPLLFYPPRTGKYVYSSHMYRDVPHGPRIVYPISNKVLDIVRSPQLADRNKGVLEERSTSAWGRWVYPIPSI